MPVQQAFHLLLGHAPAGEEWAVLQVPDFFVDGGHGISWSGVLHNYGGGPALVKKIVAAIFFVYYCL
jgi:hypothetical protein